MFLERQSPVASHQPLVVSTYLRQRGWLMPVAAFIVVVMGLLAAGLAGIVSETSVGGAQESISLQTFYAAESGAQYGMNRLFYDTVSPISRTNADANCTAVNGNTLSFSAPGMSGCQTTITCSVTVDAGSATSFYAISSNARCQLGDVNANRIIDVSAYLK